MEFPAMRVRDLEGVDYVIPDELPGGPHVIILAFHQWHQMIVNRWTSPLEAIAEKHPGTEVWEVPSMSRGYRLFRSGIDGGMRAGIPDMNVRRHTLTAYTDLVTLRRHSISTRSIRCTCSSSTATAPCAGVAKANPRPRCSRRWKARFRPAGSVHAALAYEIRCRWLPARRGPSFGAARRLSRARSTSRTRLGGQLPRSLGGLIFLSP